MARPRSTASSTDSELPITAGVIPHGRGFPQPVDRTVNLPALSVLRRDTWSTASAQGATWPGDGAASSSLSWGKASDYVRGEGQVSRLRQWLWPSRREAEYCGRGEDPDTRVHTIERLEPRLRIVDPHHLPRAGRSLNQ